MKVINDLLDYNNLKILQDTDYFCFSLDSVLLANYPQNITNKMKILDIGTGNAPIPMILSTKTKVKIYAVELQKEMFDLAKESIEINNLEDRIELINDDVKNINKYFKIESFDYILSNPPYFKINDKSKINDVSTKAYARHEIALDIDELLKISFKYLKNNGKFDMVHRTERMTEILEKMHKYKLEPKRILVVFPKENKESNFFLVEGVKNAKAGLKEVKYLIAHKENGEYTEEVKAFFKQN